MKQQEVRKTLQAKRDWQKHIGAHIRYYRLRKKYSLRKLGRCTGLSAHRLDLYECGRSDMHLAELLVIASVLHISPLQLLAGWREFGE